MPAPNIEQGILVGRPSFGKSIYEYIVVPENREDVDVLETSLPKEIQRNMYVVNTRGVAKYLKGIYYVKYRWKQSFTQTGVMHRAILLDNNEYTPVVIDIDNPLEAVKHIDQDAEFHPFEEPPLIDSEFLLSLSRSTGAGANMPKRFLATPVATVIVENEDKKIPVLINIMEMYLWMQENPSRLRGLLLLPSYKFAIIIAEPITKTELKDEILNKTNASISVFRNDYLRAGIVTEEEEE